MPEAAMPAPELPRQPDADTVVPPHARKAAFGRTVRAVAWSFLGIRKSSEHEQDVLQLNPIHVIVAGVLGAALFVLVLVLVVGWVTSQ